ncbi:uncharacterized protein B0H64DRAFT_57359 [Chaetomium fimeti]|uniref:Uncharacterized protein n=1 Tax=Chaetomium fimeti TaxID=1854472 RepID=A0AAE0LMJ6_9PEZI|nr:hypothetical protein B0H64DRAFT_57359 [Chaetomium fimeti]
MPAAQEQEAQEAAAQEAPAEDEEAVGPTRIVVRLTEMSAAARAEFRVVSPEVKPEADTEFVSDDELDEDDEDEDDDDESERDHRPPPRRQKRRRVQGVPNELGASVDRFLRGLPQITVEAQRWMTENLPRITGLSQVQRMLPRLPIGSAWTAKDRANVDRAWRKSAQRKELLDVAKNKDLLTLHKCCLRLMRCLPEDIIGCRFDLKYDLDQNRALARGQSLLWSGPFCKSLAALLVHPMWDGAVAPLAAAIQYTVIVETNDNGPWVMDVPGCDEFLAGLLKRKREQPEKNTAELRRELHEKMVVGKRDKYGRETGICLSRWDTLFHVIEKLAALASAERSGQTPSPRETRGASEPFLVHRRHLELLIKALDSMTHMGFPQLLPLEVLVRGISGRRSVKDYPQAGHIVALREYSLLCERERVAYDAKLALAARVTNDHPVADDTETHEELESPATQSDGEANTLASGNPQIPDTQGNGEAVTHSREKPTPETQYSARGHKRPRPSQPGSISPDNAQNRARTGGSSTPENPEGSQLELRLLDDSPSDERDLFNTNTAPTISRGVDDVPISLAQVDDQGMEFGDDDDAASLSEESEEEADTTPLEDDSDLRWDGSCGPGNEHMGMSGDQAARVWELYSLPY